MACFLFWILFSLPFVLIGLFFYFFIIKSKSRYLRRNGVTCKAKVENVEITALSYGSGIVSEKTIAIVKLVILEGGATGRKVTVRQGFLKSVMPQRGDELLVLIDPQNLNKAIII
ncbi:hypothetical protein ACEN9X_24930 [Mucilaginibacter sp. Mucisp86]|uniref:hypothetical protein n=1 Tax=Mucilaginibacter sp. Mucisp86 TaxID=3243060 RepID=UPI0039B5D383